MLKLTYYWDLCSSERTTTSTGMDLGLTRVDLLQVGLTYPKSTRLLPNVSPTERTQQKVLEVLFCICIYYQITMLQKISKCEVKAWLCWNLIKLLSLRFYVKLNFGKFKLSKNVIFDNFRDSEPWILVNLGHESCSNLLKIKI